MPHNSIELPLTPKAYGFKKSVFTEASALGAELPGTFCTSSTIAMQSALEDAFLSAETRTLEHRISELRNAQSPASFPTKEMEKSVEERLFDATASVKILTSAVAMHLDSVWREKLFRQIDSLHDPEEWDPEDTPVRQASFNTFLKAIFQLQPNRLPGLGLSHAGFLIAAWTTGQNRLTIEFLANDRVRWVISRRHDNESEQYAGHTSVSRLREGLQAHHPEEWFSKW